MYEERLAGSILQPFYYAFDRADPADYYASQRMKWCPLPMIKLALRFVGFVAAIIYLAAEVAAQSPEEAKAEIRAVIATQEEAWNRGDIEQFMAGYARAETTTFVSGDEVTRGWQNVLDRYKNRYSDRAKMGSLTFSELEITALGVDAAVALGRWELQRANDHPRGRFTLIFRRLPEGWRIVQDHTSAASPP
jgi:ketosteroid isomerase-like protein